MAVVVASCGCKKKITNNHTTGQEGAWPICETSPGQATQLGGKVFCVPGKCAEKCAPGLWMCEKMCPWNEAVRKCVPGPRLCENMFLDLGCATKSSLDSGCAKKCVLGLRLGEKMFPGLRLCETNVFLDLGCAKNVPWT